jgi:hypothetical protein
MWRRAAAVNNNRDQKKNSQQVRGEIVNRAGLTTERDAWFVELAFNALAVFVIACCAIIYCYC